MVALFIGLVTISVAMIGFRKWQTGIAIQLLEGRGLSELEAKQHIALVKQRNKIPIFADAPVIAGLESGQQILTSEQRAYNKIKMLNISRYMVDQPLPLNLMQHLLHHLRTLHLQVLLLK